VTDSDDLHTSSIYLYEIFNSFEEYPFFFDQSKLSSSQDLTERFFNKLRVFSKGMFGKFKKRKNKKSVS